MSAITSGKRSTLKNCTMVEGYCTELKCYKNCDMQHEVRLRANKSDKLSTVHRKLRSKFNLLDGELSRLLRISSKNNLEVLDLEKTVRESGFSIHETVLLQTQKSGEWCQIMQPLGDKIKPKSDLKKKEKSSPSGIALPKERNSVNSDESGLSPGICGLMNLGNSCYMNSVIQCLSNCPPLTEYFLNDRHLLELNSTNALGTRGEIAKAYGSLLKVIWSGKHAYTKPLLFMTQVARYNSLFSGFSQHDAQELLTYLLDGLHEDLSRSSRSSDDQQVSQNDPWRNYKSRNDSIVVDIFHGLLKSRVICPQCERLSVTFDAFCSLSLPLPMKEDRFIKVHFIPKDPTAKECSLNVAVPRKGLVRELCKEVALKTNTNYAFLVPAEVSNLHFHKFYTHDDKLDRIDDKDPIYMYEMPQEASDEDFTVVPVCFWDLSRSKVKVSLKNGFGIPLLLMFSNSELKNRKIANKILHQIEKRFNLPIEYSGKKPNYMPNIYLVETALAGKRDPLRLDFDDTGECTDDLLELLDINKPDRDSGRKMLIVDLSLAGRDDFLGAFSLNSDRSSYRKCSDNNSELQVYDCIDLFASCEKLGKENAWYCPTCKQHQRATKKFDIWTLPKILVLHFKRFSYSRHGGKLDTPVGFPLKDLCISSYVINPAQRQVSYDLIGVINHYGSMSGGHYTAYCRNKDTGSWFCFNDNTVTPIHQEQVVSSSAYVLFYSRNDDSVKSKT